MSALIVSKEEKALILFIRNSEPPVSFFDLGLVVEELRERREHETLLYEKRQRLSHKEADAS